MPRALGIPKGILYRSAGIPGSGFPRMAAETLGDTPQGFSDSKPAAEFFTFALCEVRVRHNNTLRLKRRSCCTWTLDSGEEKFAFFTIR